MQTPGPFSQWIPITPSDSPIPFPTPLGPHKVGTVSLEATDTSRLDPFGFVPHHRRLMFSLFYPTSQPEGHSPAAYLPSARMETDFDGFDHLPRGTHARFQPQAHSGAPVLQSPKPGLPIVLFSTGFGVLREHYTMLLQDLASQGYFCLAIGHTYDTTMLFPDDDDDDDEGGGELVWQIGHVMEEAELSMRVRAQDASFALSQLARAEFRDRIPGLRADDTLDLGRVGILGHSLGGAAALEAMRLDGRIVAGVNLDGAFQGDQMTVGTDRPFLVISAPKEKDDEDATLGKTWEHLRGWKAAIEIEGAAHLSFTDFGTCYKLLGVLDSLDPKRKLSGTIDPSRMMTVLSTYLTAFFDSVFRGGSDDLFHSPDQAFPEVKICFKE